MTAPTRIPRARIALTHRQLRDALRRSVDAVLFEDLPAGDAAVEEVEQLLAAAVGRRVVLGVQSGTSGLMLALRAVGVGPGDEVITVANSDISTTAAITHCGAVPVLCDIRADDYTIDPDGVASLITSRTRAVLPVDLYGHPADVRALRRVADRHGLAIVEDAALALGARDYGRPVGAFADVVVYSFAPYKPLGCVGNGGAVATDSAILARRLRVLRGYGASPDAPPATPGLQRYVEEGFNLPLDPLQAAVLRVKLPHLDAWTRRRREVAQFYARRLAALPVVLPTFRPDAEPTFRLYGIRVPYRDQVYAYLRERGIEAVIHYAPPVHRHPVYADRGLPGADRLPVTERVAGELLGLPVFPELQEDEMLKVVAAVSDALDLFQVKGEERHGTG